MVIDDGGPVFPVSFVNRTWNSDVEMHVDMRCTTRGLSLRDEFARTALRCILGNPATFGTEPLHVAGWAYRYADAMLEERRAREKEGTKK